MQSCHLFVLGDWRMDSGRQGLTAALLLVDLDRFKHVMYAAKAIHAGYVVYDPSWTATAPPAGPACGPQVAQLTGYGGGPWTKPVEQVILRHRSASLVARPAMS
jgi:hypothetical protein